MRRLLLIIALALLPLSVSAQTFKQYQVNVTNTLGVTTTFGSTTTAGSAIIVSCQYSVTVSTCNSVPTDTEGNTFVADGANFDSAAAGIAVYHAFNIHGGSLDAVTCHQAATFNTYCAITEVAGVNALDQVRRDQTASTTSANTGAVTTTHANEFIYASINLAPSASAFWNGDDAAFVDLDGLGGIQLNQYRIVSSTGSYSGSGTNTPGGEAWVAWISTYYQASGATSVTSKRGKISRLLDVF